jgi:DNA-binding response OmpR family regulator
MPYEIVKKKSGKYEVINRITGEIHAKGTTLNKAKAQVRLLESRMRGAGPIFSGNVQVRPDAEPPAEPPVVTRAELEARALEIYRQIVTLEKKIESITEQIEKIERLQMLYHNAGGNTQRPQRLLQLKFKLEEAQNRLSSLVGELRTIEQTINTATGRGTCQGNQNGRRVAPGPIPETLPIAIPVGQPQAGPIVEVIPIALPVGQPQAGPIVEVIPIADAEPEEMRPETDEEGLVIDENFDDVNFSDVESIGEASSSSSGVSTKDLTDEQIEQEIDDNNVNIHSLSAEIDSLERLIRIAGTIRRREYLRRKLRRRIRERREFITDNNHLRDTLSARIIANREGRQGNNQEEEEGAGRRMIPGSFLRPVNRKFLPFF